MEHPEPSERAAVFGSQGAAAVLGLAQAVKAHVSRLAVFDALAQAVLEAWAR